MELRNKQKLVKDMKINVKDGLFRCKENWKICSRASPTINAHISYSKRTATQRQGQNWSSDSVSKKYSIKDSRDSSNQSTAIITPSRNTTSTTRQSARNCQTSKPAENWQCATPSTSSWSSRSAASRTSSTTSPGTWKTSVSMLLSRQDERPPRHPGQDQHQRQ